MAVAVLVPGLLYYTYKCGMQAKLPSDGSFSYYTLTVLSFLGWPRCPIYWDRSNLVRL